MPEIDKDLFQLLNLALLGLGALLLLGLLSSLSSIRKLLKKQLEETQNLARAASAPSALEVPPPGETPEPALLPSSPVEERPPSIATPDPSHYGIDDFDNRPLVGGAAAAAQGAGPSDELRALSEDSPRSEAAPDEAAATPPSREAKEQDEFASQYDARAVSTGDGNELPAEDPFADEPASASARSAEAGSSDDPFGAGAGAATADPFAARAGTETGDAEPVTAGPGSKMDDPFLTEPAGDENPFMRGAEEPAPQSTLDEPEDQPFERNGRWFFRRDGELLVYEEGTGEWVPADPSDAAPPSGARPPLQTHDTPSSAQEVSAEEPSFGAGPTDTEELDAVDTGQPAARASGAGGFWKCPSCGAVNGSSADTCRMCFSARP